ncbi:MAG: ATP-binding cassette domain-containing protein [Fimbriimonadaceae bacterium]
MLLSVSGLSKSFGIDIVLEDVSFRVEPKEKVALVGRNGTGKTTLLKILTGELEADSGSVHFARGARIGYLRQEAPVRPGRTVLEEVESAREREIELRRRMAELEERMLAGPTDEDLDEYALVHEHFLEAEGYSAESDVRTVLSRMGFAEEEFSKLTESLSGGERTRLAIARLLLEEPELLVLDEPTNHLDLQATEWLEGWITSYHGAVLLVSHDREFLANTAQRTIELREHRAEAFPGGFEKYLALRAERDARLAEVAKRQDQQIAKLDEYVRRFMNSQRTAQARGRLKHKEKLEGARVKVPKSQRSMVAGVKAAKRSGDIVVECRDLSVGFSDETLFSGLDWTVRWGDRWGVIGENGAGKSTLVRTVLGERAAVAGTVRLGSNVEVGFFAQDAEGLDQSLSPLEFLSYECGMDAGPARDLLGRFLIEGDDVFRQIKTLSGGEKNKLALARLSNLSPNLLVLDEPTNHLDMASREALASVLREYRGTLVLVSHDRWLLRQVTSQILDVRREGAVLFGGSYDEYRRKVRGASKVVVREPVSSPQEALSPRELSKAIERQKKELAEKEGGVSLLERRISELERELASPSEGADLVAMTTRYGEMREELERRVTEWESAGERLEELEGRRRDG